MFEIDFDKMQGLVPAIVQDSANGEILMLGFMNRAALGENAGDRLRHLLQPNPQRTLDQG